MFHTFIHRPCWRQVFICLFPYIAGTIGLIALGYVKTFFFHEICLAAGLIVFIWLLYKAAYYTKIEYIFTNEQIILLHGVFSYTTDYMEMYRVVDYRQKRTFVQQLLKVKTITIYSMDKNMSTLNIIGVPENNDMVNEIRYRVEYNKKRKGIYEITNR